MGQDVEKRGESGEVEAVFREITGILETARSTAFRAINTAMVQAYWQIGRVIVEEEQRGKKRAGYGTELIKELSRRLTADFGKGFTERNLRNMRRFYTFYPKWHAVRTKLTWTHYRLLLKVENSEACDFYMLEAIDSNWSTRELERQINSLLFERLTLSGGKRKSIDLSTKGQEVTTSADLIKDPYVLEFLGTRHNSNFLEKDLEQGLINRLRDFLLELGKGFALVARQKRITIDGDHFYIDLVFYNHILRCFVLIDLKTGKLSHADIGQMDFYVRWFEGQEKREAKAAYSHSIVLGGFEDISSATRLTPGTSLMMRLETVSSRS
jgi:predicted nuclease of restriction endonuclease-like (RecB) superfamily